MKSSPLSRVVTLAAVGASVVMAFTACGSADKPSAAPETSSASAAPVTDPFTRPFPPPASVRPAGCPSAAPSKEVAPEWTLDGATGHVAVTGSTATAAPRVTVSGPFSVTETRVHTLHAGDGPVVSATARVSVCYLGVNGRDGSIFDSSYEQGAPVDFSLTGVIPGFQKAIAGQRIGSTVAVAMSSADGYPDGEPGAGIRPGDSLVFEIKILSATN